MENYPKRGQKSDDGRYYTHTDGSVHEIIDYTECATCSVFSGDDCDFVCPKNKQFRLIKGACFPNDEVKEACDKMREMIQTCQENGRDCVDCGRFQRREDCPARLYLAKHKQEDAWTK